VPETERFSLARDGVQCCKINTTPYFWCYVHTTQLGANDATLSMAQGIIIQRECRPTDVLCINKCAICHAHLHWRHLTVDV